MKFKLNEKEIAGVLTSLDLAILILEDSKNKKSEEVEKAMKSARDKIEKELYKKIMEE